MSATKPKRKERPLRVEWWVDRKAGGSELYSYEYNKEWALKTAKELSATSARGEYRAVRVEIYAVRGEEMKAIEIGSLANEVLAMVFAFGASDPRHGAAQDIARRVAKLESDYEALKKERDEWRGKK